MKRNRHLDKIVDQSIKASFKDGKLVEPEAEKLVNAFKKQSKAEAIYLVSNYLKGLKREIAKQTLTIESATPLSKSEVAEIKQKLANQLTITNDQLTINPDLLGGIRVKVADMVYDLSIKGKLEQLKGAIKS